MKKSLIKIRYAPLHSILAPLIRFYLHVFRGCRFKINHIPKTENCLILANHVNSTEPIMLEVSFDRPVCFLAQNGLLAEPLFRVLGHLTPFIAIDKGTADASAVMKCLRYVRDGGILAIYPEGNLTYDGVLGYMNPAIIKLIRMLRVPVIYYNIRGAYGVDPRFGKTYRCGTMAGYIAGHRKPDEIAAMSDSELLDDIQKMLSVDEFSEPCSYKSKNSAEFLERVIYRCPDCGQIGSIRSHGRYISCSCGLTAEYCDDLTFRPVSGKQIPHRVRDWISLELEWIKSYIPSDNKVIFSDSNVLLEKRSSDLSFVKTCSGEMTMKGNHLSVGQYNIEISSVSNIVLIKKQTLMIFSSGQDVYRINAPDGFCGLKYIHMFHRLRQLRNNSTIIESDNYFGM